MDDRLFLDDSTWLDRATDAASVFGTMDSVDDAVRVVAKAAAAATDTDGVLDALCAQIDAHPLHAQFAELDHIASMLHALPDTMGDAAYALTSLFVACHVSVERSRGATVCGLCLE